MRPPPTDRVESRASADVERRLEQLGPIATATVTTTGSPLCISGTLTDERRFHFNAQLARAWLFVGEGDEDPSAGPAVSKSTHCDLNPSVRDGDHVVDTVARLLIDHGVMTCAEDRVRFSRHDYSTARRRVLDTDGGTVTTTVGLTDEQGRHVIDIRVQPHVGRVADPSGVPCVWDLVPIDGGIRLVCEPDRGRSNPIPSQNPDTVKDPVR